MTTKSYDDNLREVSKLLKVKIDIEDNVLEGTGDYAVAHAVYRLQKVCNITDFDIGSNHCQALDLQQTLQMWKALKFLKTLPMEQNDNDSDNDSDSDSENENVNQNENKNDNKNDNEIENDSENGNENENDNESENDKENDKDEKGNDKENENDDENENGNKNDNENKNHNYEKVSGQENDNVIICNDNNEHEVVDERLVMVNNEVKNPKEELINPLILSQDLLGRCSTVIEDDIAYAKSRMSLLF